MAINKEQLYNDIHRNYIKLIRNEKKNSIRYLQNYYRLLIVLEDVYGETVCDKLFLDHKKMRKYEDKTNINNVLYFEKIIKSIDKDLLRLSKNYKKCFVKDIDYYLDIYSSNIRLKSYNKKDFFDIILSFYSEYGNNIYSIVKDIIEKNNIIFVNEFKNCFCKEAGAYLAFDTLSKNNYVISSCDKYNIDNLMYFVHEFGHIIDNTLYKYKQNKNLFNICDLYEEVPSAMFEISFLNYLYENKIESNVAFELIIFRLLEHASFYNIYKNRLNNDNYYFEINGYILDEQNDYGKCVVEEIDNFRDDFIYFLGYILGLNFMLNTDNKEKSMKEFTNFLCMRKENTFKQSIETLGLNYDEFLACTLIKPYIKEKNNELIKRYK